MSASAADNFQIDFMLPSRDLKTAIKREDRLSTGAAVIEALVEGSLGQSKLWLPRANFTF